MPKISFQNAVPIAGPYPPLARLGRWDGAAFVPVEAASIAPGRATFIAHGWATGCRAAYERLQGVSEALVAVWTPGVHDGHGVVLIASFIPLVSALQAADPDAAVVMFSWLDQSATGADVLDARQSEHATEINGHRLAVAIDQALAPGFHAGGGRVHVIGHSFGANVATTAALAMRRPPRQLTLLDSPEVPLARLDGAKNNLAYALPRLDIGRGPHQTFVDSYISAVGEAYSPQPGLGHVVDVRTLPPDGPPVSKHLFAIGWYAASVREPAAGVGYGWSPMGGAQVGELGARYAQRAVGELLALECLQGPPVQAAPGPEVTREDVAIQPWRTRHRATAPPRPPRALTVGAGRPGAADIALTTTDHSLWLEFDLVLAGRAGDLLTIAVDGRPRYQAAVGGAGAATPGAFLALHTLRAGRHRVTVSLSDASGAGAAGSTTTARLDNLREVSMDGIVRNLTGRQTRLLLVVALAGVGAVVVVALLALARILPWPRRSRGRPWARRLYHR